LNIFTGILVWTKKLTKAVKIQQIINVVCFLSVLIIAAFSFQSIEFAFIPLIALLLIRSLRWLQANNQYKKR
jgi:predicted RND superfamily exporter protein